LKKPKKKRKLTSIMEQNTQNIKISDLVPDAKNANKGTPRGRGMLEKSLQSYGAGRSILIDKHNRIIAGNKTTEVAGAIGIDDVQVVESDGRRIIAVRRVDLDLDTDVAAKELAIADNRVAQEDLSWDNEALRRLQEDGVELEKFFAKKELDEILGEEKTSPGSDLPQMELGAFEKYDYVVIVARNNIDLARLHTILRIEKVNASFVEGAERPGLGRVVECKRLFDLLDSRVEQSDLPGV
jgi:hypothetical protein